MRIVLLALAINVSGCTCIGDEIRMQLQPEVKEVSDVARNDKAPWRRAHVRRDIMKTFGGGRDPFRYWFVTDYLTFREGPENAPELWSLNLRAVNEQRHSMDAVKAQLKERWKLTWAADGHALAVRLDRKDEPWTYVALDLGDYPYICEHWRFGAGDDDPFAAGSAPSTRALLLDVLRGVVEKGKHHDDTVYSGEVDVAVKYACTHRGDKELVEAARAAVERRGKKKDEYDIKGIDASCLDEK